MARLKMTNQFMYWTTAILFVGCIVLSYSTAYQLYGDGKVMRTFHTAWWLEALPWLFACALAVILSRTRVLHNPALSLSVPLLLSTMVVLWLVAQPLAYSLDLLRYMWDGRLLMHGVNPFQYVPADAHIASYRSWPYWWLMGWKEWPEAYPPVAQVYFALIAFMTNGTVLQYKTMLIANQVASVALFYAVLVERRRQVMQREGSLPSDAGNATANWLSRFARGATLLTKTDVRQFTLFLLFPPLLVESFGSGHVDMFAIPWLLTAWICHLKGRPVGMGLAIATAACIKVYPLILAAAFIDLRAWRYNLKAAASFVALVSLVYLPFWSAKGGLVAFFTHVSEMTYNGSLEYVLAKWFGPVLDAHASILIVVAELAVWYVVLFTRATRFSVEQKVCFTGLAFILASPVMHPWYLLPLIPFAIGACDLAILWLAVSSHLTYDDVFLDMYIEYVPTYALLVWQFRRRWRQASME